MLRAVDVPGRDLEDDGLFGNAAVIGVVKSREKIGFVVDDPGTAPNLIETLLSKSLIRGGYVMAVESGLPD